MSGGIYVNSGELVLTDLGGLLWRLEEPAWIYTGIKEWAFRLPGLPQPGRVATSRDVCAYHTTDGVLHVERGLVFDGSSVPLFGRRLDEHVSGWPGGMHDVAYRAIRMGRLPYGERQRWDDLYRSMLRAFGAWWITGQVCYAGLRLFGGSSAKPRNGGEYPRVTL